MDMGSSRPSLAACWCPHYPPSLALRILARAEKAEATEAWEMDNSG